MNTALIMVEPTNRQDRLAAEAAQALLKFPACQVRIAQRPPFYRCSCGATYNNADQHPDTPGPQDSSEPEPDLPSQWAFDQ